MDTKVVAPSGSNIEPVITDMPVEQQAPEQPEASLFGAGATALSTFYTWRAHGVQRSVRFTNSRVHANSRVLVGVSEYSSDAAHRFIGAARMAVYNVAPFEGGFFAWVEIDWGSPLNVRFDVIIDP